MADGFRELVGLLLGVLVAASAVTLGVGVVPGVVGDAVAVSAGVGVAVAAGVAGTVPVAAAVGVADGLRELVGLLLGVFVAASAVTLGVGVPGAVGTGVAVSVCDGVVVRVGVGDAVAVDVGGAVLATVAVEVGVLTRPIPPQKPPFSTNVAPLSLPAVGLPGGAPEAIAAAGAVRGATTIDCSSDQVVAASDLGETRRGNQKKACRKQHTVPRASGLARQQRARGRICEGKETGHWYRQMRLYE